MPKSFLAGPNDANLAERLTSTSLLHSSIANNALQVFFLVGHSAHSGAGLVLNVAATPLFALIYKVSCVKLPLALKVG